MANRYATTADVIALFPALAAGDAGVLAAIGEWLTATQPLISLTVWGVLASQGHACLAAHNAAVAGAFVLVPGAPGENGIVTSEANGPASRSFGVWMGWGPDEGLYSSSPYGRKYIEFRRQIVGRGVALISNMRPL